MLLQAKELSHECCGIGPNALPGTSHVKNAGTSSNSTHTTPFWKCLTFTLRVLPQKVQEQ